MIASDSDIVVRMTAVQSLHKAVTHFEFHPMDFVQHTEVSGYDMVAMAWQCIRLCLIVLFF